MIASFVHTIHILSRDWRYNAFYRRTRKMHTWIEFRLPTARQLQHQTRVATTNFIFKHNAISQTPSTYDLNTPNEITTHPWTKYLEGHWICNNSRANRRTARHRHWRRPPMSWDWRSQWIVCVRLSGVSPVPGTSRHTSCVARKTKSQVEVFRHPLPVSGCRALYANEW